VSATFASPRDDLSADFQPGFVSSRFLRSSLSLSLTLSLSLSLSLSVCVHLSFIPSALKRVIPKPRYRIPSRLAARRAADAALPAPRLYIYMPYLLNLLQFNFNKRTGWPACLSGANGKKRGQTRPRSSNYSRRDFRRPIRDAN